MKKLFYLSSLLLLVLSANAQIGIGTSTVDASAALEIKANGSAVGLLLPRLTTTERDASIKSPVSGLVIYNSTTKVIEVSTNNSLWMDVINGTNSSVASGTTTTTGGIGMGTILPNANAILDVTSTTKGVLLPQSATDPVNVEGMIYYNTTFDVVKLYNGTTWVSLTN